MNPLPHSQALNPFVRYAHRIDPGNTFSRDLRCAYDHRLFFAVRGRFSVRTEQELFPMEEGTLLLLAAGTPYAFENATQSTVAIGINFDLTQCGAHRDAPIVPARPADFCPEGCVERLAELPELPVPFPIRLQRASVFAEAVEQIEADYTSASPLYHMRNSARLKLLMSDLFAMLLQPPKHSDTVDRVMEFIHAHYAEPLSNGEIGTALNFHPNYINRILLRTTGMTLHAYLLRTRINHAIQLLQTTALPMRQIAEQCGFGDPQQFVKIFRRHTGHTPGEYRRIF